MAEDAPDEADPPGAKHTGKATAKPWQARGPGMIHTAELEFAHAVATLPQASTAHCVSEFL